MSKKRANTVPGTANSLFTMLKILEENKIIELGVYMNVSLKGTDCLQKSIFFPLTSV